jgi:hypothetical protein
MQPVLKRINDQIVEVLKPPSEIAPAQAGTPSTGGYFGGVGYSVAIKQVSQLKKLSDVIEFTQRTIVQRNTVAQGFIGIGNYSEEIKKLLVLSVDGTINPGTYLAFPQVPRGLDRVDLTVSLQARGQQFSTGQYQYLRSTNAWKDLQTGATPDRISFSLAGVEQAFGKSALKDAQFRINKTLSTELDSTAINSLGSVSEGASAVNLQDNLVGVRLMPSALMFKQIGGDLNRVSITAKSGGKSKSYVFEAVNINGTWQAPANEFFFAPEKGQPVELSLRSSFVNPTKNSNRQFSVTADGLIDVFLDEEVTKP